MKLGMLIEKIAYRLAQKGHPDYESRPVARVVTKAEEAGEDALYVCLRTATQDGHTGAACAYRKGCRLFLAERSLLLPKDATVLVVESTVAWLGPIAAELLGHPARELTVIGITGSTGKSSVADTVATVLHRLGRQVACVTTDGVRVGERRSPRRDILHDAAELQALLHGFVREGVEVVILELSSYMLMQGSAFSIPFTAVLLTNLFPDYGESSACGSASAYVRTMASLFAGDAAFQVLPANFVGFSVTGKGQRLTFGPQGNACAAEVESHACGTSFRLCLDGESAAVSLPVVGDFAIENALAAALLLRIAGVGVSQIATELSAYAPEGRMECIARKDGRAVFIDTAYTARDLTRALLLLRKHTKGRLTVVLGSVGERERGRRAPLGEAATTHADFAYFTADDPGYELPRRIAEEMASGAVSPRKYAILPDRREAIAVAVRDLRPGDTLLLAGKGAQEDQRIRDERVPFSERELVKTLFSTEPPCLLL